MESLFNPSMPSRRCAFLLCLCLIPGAHLSAQSVEGTMPEDYLPGLKEILTKALDRSPTVLAQQIQLAQAEARTYSDSAGLWPNLSGSAAYANNTAEGSSSSSTSSGFVYGINLSQPIYAFGALKAQSDIGKLGEQIAAKQYAEAFRSLAGTLRTQYVGLILKKTAIRNARYQVQLQQAELDYQKGGVDLGTVTQGQINALQLALDQANVNLDRQVQDLGYARAVFMRLAGLSDADFPESAIPDEVPLPTRGPDSAAALAGDFAQGGVHDTDQARILALNVQQSELNAKIASTRLLPKANLRAGYGLNNSTNVNGAGQVTQSNVTSRNFSVGIDWTLFDGFATRGARRSALSTTRSYERQLQTYVDSTVAEAENRAKSVDFAWRDLQIAEQRRRNAQGGIQRTKDDMGVGVAAQSDLDRATTSLQNAELAAFNARAAYLQQWADFVSLIGADPVSQMIPQPLRGNGE